MHRIIFGAVAIALSAMPLAASAHESRTVRIGTEVYQFTVGSLNEPIIVDDKTGVDLTVKELDVASMDDVAAHADMQGMIHLPDGTMIGGGTPVAGLEKTLEVELRSGDASRVLPLTTVYGSAGKYKAVFIPTTPGTYAYRIFGTVAGKDIDLTFTCSSAGHVMTSEPQVVNSRLTDDVTLLVEQGAFGCPAEKEAYGFPAEAPSLVSLERSPSYIPVGLSVLALAGVLYLLSRRRNTATENR